MRNVNKLLVPIDFSLESERALKYASALAIQIDAQLIALHVVEECREEAGGFFLPFVLPLEGGLFFDSPATTRPLDLLLRERALDLWNFVDCIVQDKSLLRLKRLVRLGTLREEIVAVARQENIDLIVFEIRNRFLFPNRARRKLLKMIDKLPYPVLLAPPIAEDTPKRGKPIFAIPRFSAENPA